MNATVSDSTLERFTTGDEQALVRVLVAYGPLLRMVIRRRLPQGLRMQFDSTDVVQSLWGHLLSGFRAARWHFATPAHLASFLMQAALNRLRDRLRRQRLARRVALPPGEEPADRSAAGPPSAEAQAEAEDLWQRMLQCCPARHRGLLTLKRQGYSLAEIANRTGLHPSSVRRILYDLASRLAVEGIVEARALGA